MKITKTLSILSIVSCFIYIIVAFALAVFPIDVCILFGMTKNIGINPDYIAHTITPGEFHREAYEIYPVYNITHISLIAFNLVFVILSAVLVLQKKTKRFPVFLAVFSSAAFGIISILVQMITQYTLSGSQSETDFYVINSIHRFFLLFGICGAVLCVIAAVYSKTKLNKYVLAIASICFSIFYLVPNICTLLLNGSLNEYGKYYSVAAVGFIILSILSYFGKTGRRTAVLTIILAAAFPLVLQLLLMSVTGDYYGFMSLNSWINDNDTVLYKWLISGICCAVSSLKGAYPNENPENS